jgi:cysteine-rich repeat protein
LSLTATTPIHGFSSTQLDPTVDRGLQVTLPPVADYLFFAPTITSGVMGSAVTGLGKTFAVASAAQFNIMTVADFKKYKAIVFADPDSGSGTTPIDGAMASRAIWSAAVDGNVIVIGTDETGHWGSGGQQLATNALAFAAGAAGKTGLYFSLSEYYQSSSLTPVPILDQFGSFTAEAASGGCYDDAHIVASHPVTNSLTDSIVSNWGCSVHEVLPSYPPNFIPLVIAENIGTTPFADETVGTPYIVIRGEAAAPVRCGNGILEAPEECDDGNIANGDGCSQLCKKEVCGDGLVGKGEQCDDGNTAGGDGCSSTCQIEGACTGRTYWLWDPKTDKVVGELKNNSALCIPSLYNIEVRLCAPPKKVPVLIVLKTAALVTHKTKKEFEVPFYLWGDTPATGDVYRNTKPLPKGAYWLYSTADGVQEKIKFTKTC